ncbi:MAG TPA: lipopolysaccharide kinase InaA family protein [Planctomycetaceae bacterium]
MDARQPSLDLAHWDGGRMQVNRRFSRILEANGLTTCQALLNLPQGQVVRQIKSRSTSRIALTDDGAEQKFYIKRHGPPGLRERIRPLINLSRPILGARNEWEAILRFYAAGLPTVTPVAFGQLQQHSFVMTQDLGTDFTLLDWINETADRRQAGGARQTADLLALKRRLIHHVAAIARHMHASGIFHQDFYLNHMLWRQNSTELDIRVIDLGRVVQTAPGSRRRIIKDLAQLDFSARRLSCRDRLRFLRLYLGRPFRPADRWLVRCIVRKSQHIAAHTAKHKL